MRRIICIAAVIIAVFACAKRETPKKGPTREAVSISALQKELAEERRMSALQRRYIEDATRTINEVNERLLDVAPLTADLNRITGTEGRRRMKKTERTEILAKIDAVKSALDADAKLLADFRARNASFAGKIDALEQMIVRLDQTIGNRNDLIAKLQASIGKMAGEVDALRKERTAAQAELDRRQTELSQKDLELQKITAERDKAYVLIEKRSRLVELGVLTGNKRLLRRTTFTLAKEPDLSKFRTIDIRNEREFQVAGTAPKIQLYPARSESFYHLTRNPDGTSSLTVDDPDRFWLIRHLVVSVEE
jgi:chromosome segregation ATPase